MKSFYVKPIDDSYHMIKDNQCSLAAFCSVQRNYVWHGKNTRDACQKK